jgi:hypothetical protein
MQMYAVYLYDLFLFDPHAIKWSQIYPADIQGSFPSGRGGHGFASVNSTLYVYGGVGASGQYPMEFVVSL